MRHRLRVRAIEAGCPDAGAGCDGQIQVLHDVLGLGTRQPKHAKRYADLDQVIEQAIAAYAGEVCDGQFPAAEHTTDIDDAVLHELLGGVQSIVED